MQAEEALRVIAAITDQSEKAQGKFAPGSAQHTLQKNRIHALRVAAALIRQELGGGPAEAHSKEALEQARAPLASLIHKSEKALTKLTPGTWQHTRLANNLRALHLAAPLLHTALGDAE